MVRPLPPVGKSAVDSETRADSANAFYAIGNHAAMGISPFGVERQADASTWPLGQAYGLLAQAAPEILEAQAKGGIKAVSLDTQHPAESVKLGNYTFAFSVIRMRMPPPDAGNQQATRRTPS